MRVMAGNAAHLTRKQRVRRGLEEVSLLISMAGDTEGSARLRIQSDIGFVARVAGHAPDLSTFVFRTGPVLLRATFVTAGANCIAFGERLFIHETFHVFLKRKLRFFFGGIAHVAQRFTVAGGTVVTRRTTIFDSMACIGIVLTSINVTGEAGALRISRRSRSSHCRCCHTETD